MKLLLIGLGQLTGAVLDSVARDGRFAQIVLASRNAELGRAKVQAARIGAALEGEYPRIAFVPLDFNAASAPETLKRIAPDVAFAAPSLLPRRRIRAADAKRRAMPAGVWLACHLAPMLRLRDAWAKSGINAPWVAASAPDLVNAILHLTGIGPTAGSGGIATAVPRIRFIAAQQAKAPVQEIGVRLVAGAALADCLAGEGPLKDGAKDWPPFMLKVTWHGQDITLAVKPKLKAKVPPLAEADHARIAASATLDLLAALGDDRLHDLHVPAPNGLVGGYPAKINRRGAAVDLPAAWDLDQAIGINATALAYDGIAALDKDGAVSYTDRAMAAFQSLLGERVERLRPQNAHSLAEKLVAAVAV